MNTKQKEFDENSSNDEATINTVEKKKLKFDLKKLSFIALYFTLTITILSVSLTAMAFLLSLCNENSWWIIKLLSCVLEARDQLFKQLINLISYSIFLVVSTRISAISAVIQDIIGSL